MRIYQNGIYRDMTENERAEYANQPEQPQAVALEERLNALQTELVQLYEELSAAKNLQTIEKENINA